jgi:hypothetical protein
MECSSREGVITPQDGENAKCVIAQFVVKVKDG